MVQTVEIFVVRVFQVVDQLVFPRLFLLDVLEDIYTEGMEARPRMPGVGCERHIPVFLRHQDLALGAHQDFHGISAFLRLDAFPFADRANDLIQFFYFLRTPVPANQLYKHAVSFFLLPGLLQKRPLFCACSLTTAGAGQSAQSCSQ